MIQVCFPECRLAHLNYLLKCESCVLKLIMQMSPRQNSLSAKNSSKLARSMLHLSIFHTEWIIF